MVGLYDADGNAIIKYNQFSMDNINAIGVSTGYGSSGQWSIKFGPCLSKLFSFELIQFNVII